MGRVRFEGGSTVVSDGEYQECAVAIKRLKMPNDGDYDIIFKVPPINVPITAAHLSPRGSVGR